MSSKNTFTLYICLQYLIELQFEMLSHGEYVLAETKLDDQNNLHSKNNVQVKVALPCLQKFAYSMLVENF